MQFPKGKKERMQIAAIAGIVLIGVLYGIIAFVIMPFQEAYAACLASINTKQTELADFIKVKEDGKNAKSKCEQVRTALRRVDANYVLKDEHGNYNINADKDIKTTFIKNATTTMPGVRLDADPTEGQIFVIPRVQGNKFKSFVKSLSCTSTGHGSFEYILELFERIESANPYISISNVKIGAVKPDSMAQTVTFTVSWPIWENPAIASNFLPHTEQSDTPVNTTAAGANKKGSEK